MLLKFTTAGKFLQQIGRQNASTGNQDTKNVKEPADLVIYPKTNEGSSPTVMEIAAARADADTGAFKRSGRLRQCSGRCEACAVAAWLFGFRGTRD
jgi:hypothetical protein